MEENKERVSNIDKIIGATGTDGGRGEEIEVSEVELGKGGE